MTEVVLEKLLEASRVETNDSKLVITMPEKKLAVGKHNFNLTVKDDSGNESTAALITVIVVDTQAPTAVVELNDEQGRLVTDGRIEFGSGFTLNGSRSTDIGGTITSYIWELLPA